MDGFKRQSGAANPRSGNGTYDHYQNVGSNQQNEVDQELPLSIEADGNRVEPVTTNQSEQAYEPEPASKQTKLDSKQKPKRWLVALIVFVVFILLVVGGLYVWYAQQLSPVDSDAAKDDEQQFVIKDGASFDAVAVQLKENELIRNQFAFNISARLASKRNQVQAGTCKLSPALSADQILDKLTSGCDDFKSITFYPGATIEKPFYKSPSATLSQTLYVKNILREAGYTDEQIFEALSANYEGPLFAGKPANATLEGYIYGETYYVDGEAAAQSVLKTSFDEMYKVVKEFELEAKYAKQGYKSLYDGITMASIVQRELNCEDKPTAERKDGCYEYQQTIAQVLQKRLNEGIPLGADVTFIYAADMAGEQPTIDFDSPYNTRKNKGLPPGPIGTPGELALRATANPSETDYLYFVAGDDGLIYFSKTQAEHDRNTKEHCKQLCFEIE